MSLTRVAQINPEPQSHSVRRGLQNPPTPRNTALTISSLTAQVQSLPTGSDGFALGSLYPTFQSLWI